MWSDPIQNAAIRGENITRAKNENISLEELCKKDYEENISELELQKKRYKEFLIEVEIRSNPIKHFFYILKKKIFN